MLPVEHLFNVFAYLTDKIIYHPNLIEDLINGIQRHFYYSFSRDCYNPNEFLAGDGHV